MACTELAKCVFSVAHASTTVWNALPENLRFHISVFVRFSYFSVITLLYCTYFLGLICNKRVINAFDYEEEIVETARFIAAYS